MTIIKQGFKGAEELGLKPTNKWNIKVPIGIPSDVFMAIELVKDGLKNISKTVIYTREFETV